LGVEYEDNNPNPDDKVSETLTASKIGERGAQLEPITLEEIRRQARENWLRLRQQHQQGGKASSREEFSEHAIDDRGHSIDDLEE
jgi:hypothetical protein